MAKMDWNKFVTQYTKAICFSVTMKQNLPKGAPKFDKNGKKLPSPYTLFCDWMKANLKHDWCASKQNGHTLIRVADPSDAQLLANVFGATPAKGIPAGIPAGISAGCASFYQLHHSDAGYKPLAGAMGYVI